MENHDSLMIRSRFVLFFPESLKIFENVHDSFQIYYPVPPKKKSTRSSRSSRFSGNLELFGDSERKHEKEHISNGNGFIEEKSRITENFQ